MNIFKILGHLSKKKKSDNDLEATRTLHTIMCIMYFSNIQMWAWYIVHSTIHTW